MSISNLFQPNPYDLFSNSLTTNEINTDVINVSGDSPVTSFDNFCLYTKNGSNYTLQRGPGTVYYKVHNNLFTFWRNASSGNFTFDATQGNDVMYYGPFDVDLNQPINLNIPYMLASGDGDFCTVISIVNNNVNVGCKLQINSDLGGTAGAWEFKLFPFGNDVTPTAAGVFAGTINICNFFFAAPCNPI